MEREQFNPPGVFKHPRVPARDRPWGGRAGV